MKNRLINSIKSDSKIKIKKNNQAYMLVLGFAFAVPKYGVQYIKNEVDQNFPYAIEKKLMITLLYMTAN